MKTKIKNLLTVVAVMFVSSVTVASVSAQYCGTIYESGYCQEQSENKDIHGNFKKVVDSEQFWATLHIEQLACSLDGKIKLKVTVRPRNLSLSKNQFQIEGSSIGYDLKAKYENGEWQKTTLYVSVDASALSDGIITTSASNGSYTFWTGDTPISNPLISGPTNSVQEDLKKEMRIMELKKELNTDFYLSPKSCWKVENGVQMFFLCDNFTDMEIKRYNFVLNAIKEYRPYVY